MNEFFSINNSSQISDAYSYLGHRFLSGDIEVAKYLYGHAWLESPPLIKTIRQLQYCLTAAEIEKDTTGIYCNEFLYYWSMICIGELSDLICKDLETAEMCLKKVMKDIPKVKARLAFIELLRTTAPYKNESNVERLHILRTWAGRQDFFSSIVLSKVIYYSFLKEEQTDNFKMPIRALHLLEAPCQKGHPVAIKFRNEMLDRIGTSSAMSMKLDKSYMNIDVSYDFLLKSHENMQIGSEPL